MQEGLKMTNWKEIAPYTTEEIDSNGNITVRSYYKKYDSQTDTYSFLKAKEETAGTRDPLAKGLLTSSITTRRYYKGSAPETEVGNEVFEKIFTPDQGYEENQKSRNRLLRSAITWLYQTLIIADPTNGEQNAKDYGIYVSGEWSSYSNSIITPLIEKIAATDQVTYPYMTNAILTELNTKLNIIY